VEAAGLRVSGVMKDTRVGFTGARGGLVATYARPVRLEVHGPDGFTTIPIPDIQLCLIVLLALLLPLYLMIRRSRSR